MARFLFLCLVLANLVFYVWAEGYLGRHDEGREPARLGAQLAPERLRVAPLAAQAKVSAATPVPAPAPHAESQTCLLAGPVAAPDAERLRATVEAQGAKAVVQPVEEASHWVHIPPQADRAAAERKAAELRRLGITDFFVVTDAGPTRYAISLGLFHKPEAAEELLQQLVRKGVRSAKIEARPRATDKLRLELRGPADLLSRVVKGAGAEAVDCPAN